MRGFAAGAGEPLLILFETTALAALLFVRDDRSRWQLAALGLAGAAWTKIEGTTFLIQLSWHSSSSGVNGESQ